MTDLEKLAEATVPCPNCAEAKKRHDKVFMPEACPTCHGSGRVALVPGLTRPCPGWHVVSYPGEGITHVGASCAAARCSGQVPVSEAEALVALLAYCNTNGIAVTYWPETLRLKSPVNFKPVEIEKEGRGNYCGFAFSADTLAEALCRALGLVKTDG